MLSLSNKTAIVTGSSRGIGAKIAAHLARAGAQVVVNYAGRRDAAEEVVKSIESGGGKAVAVQGDVSKPGDAKALFDAAIAKFGKVDILVNNAGIILYKRIDQTSDEEFDRLFAVNVKGTFNMLRSLKAIAGWWARHQFLFDHHSFDAADLCNLLRDEGSSRATDTGFRERGGVAEDHGQCRLAGAGEYRAIQRGENPVRTSNEWQRWRR